MADSFTIKDLYSILDDVKNKSLTDYNMTYDGFLNLTVFIDGENFVRCDLNDTEECYECGHIVPRHINLLGE